MSSVSSPARCAAVVLALVAAGCVHQREQGEVPWYQRDEVTIVVTDSGLGGVSVAAELERRLREVRHFERAQIVFFNALFSDTGGYNALSSREEKILTFDRALRSIADRYDPDQILVACNTLSVLIDDTSFAAEQVVPVRSIVTPGVELIEDALRASPDATVILFGTRTTVDEDSHRTAVARAGLNPERMVAQSCPELAAAIERGFDSEDTRLLIDTFVFEASERVGRPPGPVLCSLSCSHYPYAEALWREAMKEYDLGPVEILNPNTAMVDDFLDVPLNQRFARTEVSVTVVSMVEISHDRIQSIARAVEPVSHATASALASYQLVPQLF